MKTHSPCHVEAGDGPANEKEPVSRAQMDNAVINVLLIEENPADAGFIRAMLNEGEGGSFSLEWVTCLATGVERLKHPGVDAILLDLGLPDSNGVATFTKAALAAPNLPILILNAVDDQSLAIRAVQSGAQDYLVKNHITSHWLPRAILYAIERKRAEMHVRHLNNKLEQSNIELQNFASIASHDLQSPLRNINGFVQLLQDKYRDDPDKEAQDWMRRTREAVLRMQELIRDLLDYSRINSRSRPFEHVDFLDVFRAALALQSATRDSGVEITHDELPGVFGDRWQLVQLLQNLIGNAIKYRSGKVPRIHLSAHRGPSEWVFSLADNGIGIEPKFHEEIFEIFKRLHNQQAYPGTGIGLAVCRRVVNRHGGRIWVESAPGQGSTFHFSIPDKPGDGHDQ
jgi:two-component system, sensor histidine kinase and response regulator